MAEMDETDQQEGFAERWRHEYFFYGEEISTDDDGGDGAVDGTRDEFFLFR